MCLFLLVSRLEVLLLFILLFLCSIYRRVSLVYCLPSRAECPEGGLEEAYATGARCVYRSEKGGWSI